MILIMKFFSFMFTLAICIILNGYTQVVFKNLTDTNVPHYLRFFFVSVYFIEIYIKLIRLGTLFACGKYRIFHD